MDELAPDEDPLYPTGVPEGHLSEDSLQALCALREAEREEIGFLPWLEATHYLAEAERAGSLQGGHRQEKARGEAASHAELLWRFHCKGFAL